MSTLKPCPFCGGTKICTEKSINLNYCDNCSAESNVEHWNTRPIEDELRAEIDRLIEAGNALSNGIAEAEIPFYVLSEEILRLRTDWKLIVDSLKGG